MKASISRILLTVLIVASVFLGWNFSLQGYTVNGQSMEPSLINGEWLLVDKLSYYFSSPSRGDIIIFNPPCESDQPYIKRIIGLPGDYIEIKDGSIFITNDAGTFKYIETTDLPCISSSYKSSWEIPEDNYFVLGDNRPVSKDSRIFGTVPEDHIIGKVLVHYCSLSDWGLSPSYSASMINLE